MILTRIYTCWLLFIVDLEIHISTISTIIDNILIPFKLKFYFKKWDKMNKQLLCVCVRWCIELPSEIQLCKCISQTLEKQYLFTIFAVSSVFELTCWTKYDLKKQKTKNWLADRKKQQLNNVDMTMSLCKQNCEYDENGK